MTRQKKGPRRTTALSHGQTRSIIESMPLGMLRYRLEPDGRLVFEGANPAADRVLGVKLAAFVGKTIEEVFPKLAETEIPRRYREIVTSGQPWQTESIDYEDDRIRGAFAVQAFRTGPDTMVAAFEEISERKRSEQALVESMDLLTRFVQNSPIQLYIKKVTSTESRVLVASENFKEMIGVPGSEMVGKTMAELFPPEFAAKITKDDQSVVASGQTLRVDEELNGRSYTTFKFPIAQGERTLLAGYTIDVTERKRLEQELLKTQKLESIGTLAGGIAHDFNNLLHGIFALISMAKAALHSPEDALSMLEQAETALRRSVALTTQLLTFAKGGRPVKRVISLAPTISNAVTFALSGSRIRHELRIEEDLRRVEADDGQVGQVIQNVVLNADQAMPDGGTITVTASNSATRPGFVEIAVRDTGVGIPPAHLQRIFDPYFTTKPRGSGLGLATCYSIVRNHGGDISADSEPGRGTTITIVLPATDLPLETPGPASAPAIQGAGRILLMDDEELVQRVAKALIRSLGYSVEVAENGRQAVERFREARAAGKPFDAVILDLTIRGGMGGVETLGRLKEIDPGVKAVVSSGYSDDVTLASYRERGFLSCLGKPYTKEALREVLRGLIG